MTIDYLADHPQFIATVAQWHFAEWGPLRPGETLAMRTERLRSHAGRRAVPSAVVALEEDCVLGSALLIANDMEERPDLTPWLAGVFVAPEHRRRGIGTQLVQRVIREARELEFPTLYLYTFSNTQFYACMGWRVRGQPQHLDRVVTLMEYDLAAIQP